MEGVTVNFVFAYGFNVYLVSPPPIGGMHHQGNIQLFKRTTVLNHHDFSTDASPRPEFHRRYRVNGVSPALFFTASAAARIHGPCKWCPQACPRPGRASYSHRSPILGLPLHYSRWRGMQFPHPLHRVPHEIPSCSSQPVSCSTA